MTRISPAPSITTARLTLRAHEPGDLDECAALWGDPRVVRYIGGRAFTREEVWQRMLRYAGSWALLGFGFWIVRSRADGSFVGEVGFLDGKRAIVPPLGDDPEVGWALAPDAQGRGLAREALAAALGWADTALRAPRTVCMVEPNNTRSLALAGHLGFRDPAAATYHGKPTLILARHRPLR